MKKDALLYIHIHIQTKHLPWPQVRGPLSGMPYTVSRHPFDFGIQRATHLYWKSSNQYYLNELKISTRKCKEEKEEHSDEM